MNAAVGSLQSDFLLYGLTYIKDILKCIEIPIPVWICPGTIPRSLRKPGNLLGGGEGVFRALIFLYRGF